MPKYEREEIEDGDNFSGLDFRRISPINQDRQRSGAQECWRSDNELCFGYEECEVVSTWYFLGHWSGNCWTRIIICMLNIDLKIRGWSQVTS